MSPLPTKESVTGCAEPPRVPAYGGTDIILLLYDLAEVQSEVRGSWCSGAHFSVDRGFLTPSHTGAWASSLGKSRDLNSDPEA